ncbi:MAG TPA: DegT/DnrJ/EryC1/StrS family aminotransferase [Fimbriiglobus sp.]|jgi:dTDP-4-amino-4,6-dideoxygalactose transaminase
MPPVPLCDVGAQYRALQPEIDAAVLRVLGSGQAILGPEVAAFETEAAAYCGVKHAIGCADGTNALLLALAALDVGPGDEVICPPFTFFATAGSICRLGARPVFADIDPLTFNLDVDQVEDKITDRTRAVIPVHLFGQCADMGPIAAVAARNAVRVIEDAAQSFGADIQGKKCGGLGDVGCFSFYPSKNLGTFGDAGLVTTNDDALAAKLSALRMHGSETKYFHKYVGWNARLDAIHAAILRVKLPHVDEWIAARRAAAKRYDQLLDEFRLTGFFARPLGLPDRTHTFNQYTVRVPAHHRDRLAAHLKADGIGCDIYYPLPLHLQECLAYLGHRAGDFPLAEAAARAVLSFPMFPEISADQQRRVVEVCSVYVRQQMRLAA